MVGGTTTPGWSVRLHSYFKPIAEQISTALDGSIKSSKNERLLFEEWSTTIARICIGVRRAGTGGALLISPEPKVRKLDISQHLPYSRLGHAAVLHVLDSQYRSLCREAVFDCARKDVAQIDILREEHFADTDVEDRKDELAGAIRIVTSLASIDGLVLLTPLLEVIGFGVKLRSGPSVNRVYVGHDYNRRGIRAKRVDLSRFGTRHVSMLNYCQTDRRAIGIVISQDGQVRLIMSMGKNLTLWENMQLLRYEDDVQSYARMIRKTRLGRRGMERSLGYTHMPKTFSQLMGLKSEKKN